MYCFMKFTFLYNMQRISHAHTHMHMQFQVGLMNLQSMGHIPPKRIVNARPTHLWVAVSYRNVKRLDTPPVNNFFKEKKTPHY